MERPSGAGHGEIGAKRTATPSALAAVLPIVALAALFAITHPFSGLTGDSQIYMGRALADVDSAGVGRDLMFRLDGQSRFTIFPPIAAWLVARMSVLQAAMLIVAAASALWLCAAILLVRRAAPARVWACAAVLVLAPAAYGGFNLLRHAEALAEPRPFAEAFVILSIAAWLGDRRLVACAALAVAILFHPVMALAGVATIGLCLCIEDRHWLLAVFAVAVALAAFGPSARLATAPRAIAISATVALAALAAFLWNDASSYDRALGRSAHQADLERLTPDSSGDVLWLHASLELWIWLGRPNWSADLQGAGAVFSREIAMTYRDRAQAQIDVGLRDETMIRRIPYNPRTLHPALTKEVVAAICARPDGPAYIVAPVARDTPVDPALNAALWTPPAARVEPLIGDDGIRFERIDAYAVVACRMRR